MKGIETAFVGTLGKDAELKTSKAGKPYATLSIVVVVGQTDSGKDESQWLRVTAFGEAAETIAAAAKKGDSIYCEGQLTLNTWQTDAGEQRTGLNVAAWKAERLGGIGRAKPRKSWDDGNGKASAPPPAKPRIDFDDPLPWADA